MTRTVLMGLGTAAVLCFGQVERAAAQSEGRISVGASVTSVTPTGDDVERTISAGPLVRLNPKRGWGPAGALNWFRVDVKSPGGSSPPVARLRVRPLMAGVAYSVGPGRALISLSIVAGPSFNSIELKDEFLDSIPAGLQTPSVDAKPSFAVRPGVGLTYTAASRVAVVGFGGYLFNRPKVTFRDQFGAERQNPWKADSVVLSVGLVYSLF
jgi:hypothetical protein